MYRWYQGRAFEILVNRLDYEFCDCAYYPGLPVLVLHESVVGLLDLRL